MIYDASFGCARSHTVSPLPVALLDPGKIPTSKRQQSYNAYRVYSEGDHVRLWSLRGSARRRPETEKS